MIACIDRHKDRFGVEPLCAQLPISASTYYEHKAREADASRQPPRWHRDQRLKPEIRRVWEQNFRVYGVHKVWKQLNREAIATARWTVDRLMNELGLHGVVRGKRWRTTIADVDADRPLDRVHRRFVADRPNRLWVADLTYVSTWQKPVLRRLLESSQHLSIRYSERLAQAGLEASVGSVGDSYDNALAETVIGLYKTELIEREAPWRNLEQVEYRTFHWVDWYNRKRWMEPLGDIPPIEFEQACHARKNCQAIAA